MRMRWVGWICVVCGLLWTGSAWADAPTTIPLQGYLEDSSGAAVNDVFATTFTLYSDAAGTNALWSEEVAVNYVNGYFTAYLGMGASLDLALFRDNSAMYLGVKVTDDAEMAPFALSTSPYAGFAQYAGNAADLTDAAKLSLVSDVAVQLNNDGSVHDRYTDSEAAAAARADLTANAIDLPGGTTHDGARIISFLGSAVQNAAVDVSNNTWVDIPGTSVAFRVGSNKTVRFRGYGSVTVQTLSRTYSHCGFRFVVDGNPYGNGTWGDQIVGCGSSPNNTAGWWCGWNIERELDMTAGSYTASLQMSAWSNSYGRCTLDNEDYSRARIFVEAY